ncbi:MAG: hypothetical protein WA162_07335 [Thermodesulfobacteriota bacterium]
MRFLKSFLSAMSIVLATASYAFANNAPSALAMSSVLLVVVLIVVLTIVGGGNGVFARLQAAKYPSKVRRTLMNILEFIAGIVLFFISVYFAIFGVAAFSIYAIVRGVKMIKWSIETKKDRPRPAHLEGVSPKRLKAAGIMLIVLTLLVFGYSIINIGDMVDSSYRKRGYANALNTNAKNAHAAATAYLTDNPKAGIVTCADMEKAGYKSSFDITCNSDMTKSSGGIRITGPESWGLKDPIAVITYSGELTEAKPY